MKKLDTYLNLCTQVYDLSKPTVPEDDYKVYKSYVEQANGKILEPMCGTGRFLLPLLQDGFQVDGFDASQHMLDALNDKAKKLGLEPNVWQDYAEKISQDKKYNLIFIPSGSFGLILDNPSACETLNTFYSILNDGGKLVFEAETLKAMPDKFGVPRSSMYKCDAENMILATYFDLPPEDNVSTSICRYELVTAGSIIKTEIEDFKVRMYEPNDLKEKLENIGFSEVNLRKTFERNAVPDENDESIVYECRK
ncbi:MAG: class I SAM-dependent methyltransferase [Francisellaceae bacterium]|jgi:SAM-dependent methyltransferase|nr:class I SAM-dependent methyltransferase [Francisellaceae bacterium]MBT6539799.1 class I SAM-dependent methyltransferase [Francisellaceae bacterium]